ncbi:hypothetical protein BJ917_1089 [Pseudomonas sp. WPR_5_2]|nr:hypothetical protein BJ917_1089 [Pseudomonas sp. WPR_5_2]
MSPGYCRSWLVGSTHRSVGGLTADLTLADAPNPLWELACQRWRLVDRIHIHSCGNGHQWFRFYSGSLGRAPSNQGLLPLSFGASLWLGMPSFRSCSVGPPRSAIHGRARLNRHPCRFAHCAEPPLGLSRGQTPRKAKARRPYSRPGFCRGTPSPVGAGLSGRRIAAKTVAGSASASTDGPLFAGKPAPTRGTRALERRGILGAASRISRFA